MILNPFDRVYPLLIKIQNFVFFSPYSCVRLGKKRNAKIGFVFQFHYLLNEFTVLRNVMLPALKPGQRTQQECEHKAIECLTKPGIEKPALKNARNISGYARCVEFDEHIKTYLRLVICFFFACFLKYPRTRKLCLKASMF